MLPLRDRTAAIAAFALRGLGVGLFLICAWLSFRRHLHIDELSGLYAIQLGAAFGHAEYGTIELSSVLFRPLARWLASSQRLFVGFRILELGLLFGLCWSIARVQSALPSALGRAFVFFLAVTFGPLWRHGFEVRHDIFVAYEVVLLAWAGERARLGRLDRWASSATGLGVILVQANSLKAFTLWVPGIALCALLATRSQGSKLKRFTATSLSFLPGMLLGCALIALVFGATGMLGEYWLQLRQFTSFSSTPPYRLSALPLLDFALARAPIHFAFVLCGLLSAAFRVLTRKPLAGALVPLGAFALSALSICANPTPFPYNLTWLTPAWLLMAAYGAGQALEMMKKHATRSILFGAALGTCSGCLFLFWFCEQDPYYRKNWDSQLRVVASAEALTSPTDSVLDLCGLVISRPPVAKDWIVHSLYMPDYHAGRRETVRRIIERVWPPVAINVYRWSFLDRADLLSFRRNYVRFSDNVWTLGQTLRPNDTRFEIHRAGHYRVSAQSDAGTLDGHALHDADVLFLERGAHALGTTTSLTIAWNGPGIPALPPHADGPLFLSGELPKQRAGR